MDGPTFAQSLKSARLRAGLSQQALALKAGLTAPYVSLLEGGRRRPPSPKVIERLAAALGMRPDPLLEQAALERSPAPIRKRLEGLDRERGKVQRARDRILSTTLYRLSRLPGLFAATPAGWADDPSGIGAVLGRLAPRLRSVRSVHEAQARSEELLAPVNAADRERLLDALPDMLPGPAPAAPPDAGPTASEGSVTLAIRAGLGAKARPEGSLRLDARWASPSAFLWRLSSDEAYPRLEAGDLLVVEPDQAPVDGDLVALCVDGRDVVRVLRRRGDEVRLEALRPETAPLRMAAADLHPAGTVVRVLRSLR